MIRQMRRGDVEARAVQRGYSLESIQPCFVSHVRDDIYEVDVEHDAYPKSRGLGDMLASGLAAVGITPERVSDALGVDDCGCEQRKQQLNALGRSFGIGR